MKVMIALLLAVAASAALALNAAATPSSTAQEICQASIESWHIPHPFASKGDCLSTLARGGVAEFDYECDNGDPGPCGMNLWYVADRYGNLVAVRGYDEADDPQCESHKLTAPNGNVMRILVNPGTTFDNPAPEGFLLTLGNLVHGAPLIFNWLDEVVQQGYVPVDGPCLPIP